MKKKAKYQFNRKDILKNLETLLLLFHSNNNKNMAYETKPCDMDERNAAIYSSIMLIKDQLKLKAALPKKK